LKADEMLVAVDSAMPLVGDNIDMLEKEKIFQLAEDVRNAIRSHQVQHLKRAIATLDEATQDLAALVMERAMKKGD
ncbi:MAG: hypothetical protein QOI22_2069, partial [Verrucomicrobiota bacterium]